MTAARDIIRDTGNGGKGCNTSGQTTGKKPAHDPAIGVTRLIDTMRIDTELPLHIVQHITYVACIINPLIHRSLTRPKARSNGREQPLRIHGKEVLLIAQ